MNEAQVHRGPDGRGVFEDAEAEIALGHVRLAILDLTDHAAQPMYSTDGRFVLVYNGEIYNYPELKSELAALGCQFRSSGDTEVLLLGLQRHGLSYLDRLDGMFALALWDRRERELWLARDRLGIKPLYYTEPQAETLLFASEIKAICAHPSIHREADFEAILQHLACCHSSGDRTALKGVKRLPPGSWLRWRASDRRPVVERYWKPRFCQAEAEESPQAAAAELAERLKAATRRQLVSDVPVGSFLSGGLDSSLITAFAAAEVGPDFQCYSITYPESENVLDRANDDTPHARAMAKWLGLELQEIEIRPEVATLWPQLVHHLDEPIADPAAISCYLICKLARDQGTTVLLSGQGADELFCGYPRYRVMAATGWIGLIPRPMRRLMASAAEALPGAREGRLGAGLRRLRRVATSLDLNPDQRFLALCASTAAPEIMRVLDPEFVAALDGRRWDDDCLGHLEAGELAGSDRFQERDLSVYLPNHNLLYTDKIGMAVGLEARVPFLDRELVDRVLGYPVQWKLSNDVTKVLLRKAARGVVPDTIIDRRKAGFGAPYRKWLRYDLAEMWGDLTSEAAVRRRGWFDYDALQNARERSQSGQIDLYMLQWAVLTTELWAKQFLDQDPSMNGGPTTSNRIDLVGESLV